LIELMIALAVVSLIVILAVPSLYRLLRSNRFKANIQDFVSTMQMAVNAAAESNRRYEVIVDLTEQYYLLREITSPDLTQVLEEEIIAEGDFSENCFVEYVLFDDVEFALDEEESYTDDGVAKFRAGHSGWQYGGKIVLLDEDDQPYTVILNRVSRTVVLHTGDVEILTPKAKEDVPF
jgi:Tfp pilus assembly protein FimT